MMMVYNNNNKLLLLIIIIYLNLLFCLTNCQFTRISELNSLTLNEIDNSIYSTYPIISGSLNCYFSFQFIVTDSSGLLSPVIKNTSVTPIIPTITTLNSKSLNSQLYHFSVTSDFGSTIYNFNISNSFNSNYSIYKLNLTCNQIDINLVNLKSNKNSIDYGNNNLYISDIEINTIGAMSNHLFKSISVSTSDINKVSAIVQTSLTVNALGNCKNFYIYWDSGYLMDNYYNNDDIEITFTFGTNSLKLKFKLPWHSYDIKKSIKLNEILYIPYNLIDPMYTFENFGGINYYPLYLQRVETESTKPFFTTIFKFYKFYYFVKAIDGTKNNLLFMGELPNTYSQTVSTYTYEITEFSNHSQSSQTIQPNFKEYEIKKLGDITLIDQGSIFTSSSPSLFKQFTILFNSNNSNSYEFSKLTYSYKNDLVLPWPFGFVNGNNNNFTNQVTFFNELYENYQYGTYISIGDTPLVIMGKTKPNYENPILKSYEFKRIENQVFLNLKIESLNGVDSIEYNFKNIGLKSLVYGTIYNGEYQFLIDFKIIDDATILCKDKFGNSFEYSIGDIINFNPLLEYKLPSYLKFEYNLSILDNIQFLKNDLNLKDKNEYNIMTIKRNGLPTDLLIGLILADPVSYNPSYTKIDIDSHFPFTYDNNLDLFVCKFIIPKNNAIDEIDYFISVPNFIITSSFFKTGKLRVSDSYLDNQGPIFIEIKNYETNVNSTDFIVWRFTISDNYNGFKNGIIKIMGSLDSASYVFNFTLDDAISSSSGSNKELGTYEFFVDNSMCIEQTYQITYVLLNDQNDIMSKFELYSEKNDNDPTRTPFINFYKDGLNSTKYSVTCTSRSFSSFIPDLLFFNISTPIVDTGSNDRSISVNFNVRINSYGVKDKVYPIVYFIDEKMNSYQSTCEEPEIVSMLARYRCPIALPLGFGDGSPLLISVYGLVNNEGSYFGWSSKSLAELNFPYYLNTTISNDLPIILSTSKISTIDTSIFIYGRGFNSDSKFYFKFSNQSNYNLLNNPQISSGMVSFISSGINAESSFFLKAINTNGLESNEYLVTPYYFPVLAIPTYPPITDEPNLPTNPPQKCLGNPICGGESHGYCSTSLGCVCFPPYIGSSCQSKTIIIKPPIPNEDNPSFNLTTGIDNGGDSESSSSSSSLIGIISIVSIRELNFENQVIKTFRFDKWNQTSLGNINYYSTEINTFKQGEDPITSSKTTYITVKTEWFDQLTNITFANQQLTMNPSTLKYNINITNYAFSNKLNTLQLVIQAKVYIDGDIDSSCSSQEYGDTTTDNSNYIQLSINQYSMYGRFVKRGIIDESIKSIQNIELNDLSIQDPSTYYQSKSYIGISIPYYERDVQLDPDFGILLDSSSANSLCKNNNNSKLSKGAMIGIIVGCVGGVLLITIIIVIIVKHKYQLRNIKPVLKLKKLYK